MVAAAASMRALFLVAVSYSQSGLANTSCPAIASVCRQVTFIQHIIMSPALLPGTFTLFFSFFRFRYTGNLILVICTVVRCNA